MYKYGQTLNQTTTCTTFSMVMNLAERELRAFIRVVGELYGPDHAAQSAEDWLEELEFAEVTAMTHRDWQPVTVAAVVRLANRLNRMRNETTIETLPPTSASINTLVQ